MQSCGYGTYIAKSGLSSYSNEYLIIRLTPDKLGRHFRSLLPYASVTEELWHLQSENTLSGRLRKLNIAKLKQVFQTSSMVLVLRGSGLPTIPRLSG